jgi:S1-C subfamily serine protease
MSSFLSNLSQDLAATVETAAASVVRVEARPRLPASGIVWSADGVILTSHHVVEVEEDLRVGLPDGQTVSATFVGRDPATDLAVLRAEGAGLVPATWATSALRVGHLVLAIGRPGDAVMASLGMVLGLDGEWRTPTGALINQFVHTDVTLYPGFSGGPLVDASGQVIGVNTSGLLRRMNAVVPAETVRSVVDTLLAHGRVRRGYLGVGSQPVRLAAALAQQLNQETGLLINSVEAESPADKGGLLTGDTIVSIAGQPVRHMDDLLFALSGDRVGAQAVVAIVRGGQVKEIPVVIGERA